jgi:hypothetical protein
MRKLVLLCLFAAIIGANIYAQSNSPTTTIRGTLGLSGGRISVVSGNITYYVNGLSRFVGFIDGLKEGVQVSLDGYTTAPTIEGQNYRTFYPVTLNLNGKTYEVGSPTAGNMAFGRNSKGIGLRGRNR